MGNGSCSSFRSSSTQRTLIIYIRTGERMRTRTNRIVSYACSLFADSVDVCTSHRSKYTILFIWCVLLFAIFTVTRLRSQTDLLLCYLCASNFRVRMKGIVHMDVCECYSNSWISNVMHTNTHNGYNPKLEKSLWLASFLKWVFIVVCVCQFFLHHFNAAAAVACVSFPLFITFETRLNMQFFSMYFSCRVQSSPQRRTWTKTHAHQNIMAN